MIGEVSWNCYYSPWYLLMLIDTFPWFNFTGAWYIETIYPWYHEPMSHPHGRVKGVACNCWYCPWYLNRLIDILPWSNHTHLWYIECLLILVPMNLWPPWEGGRRVMELLLLPMVSEQCGRYIPTADCTGPFMPSSEGQMGVMELLLLPMVPGNIDWHTPMIQLHRFIVEDVSTHSSTHVGINYKDQVIFPTW